MYDSPHKSILPVDKRRDAQARPPIHTLPTEMLAAIFEELAGTLPLPSIERTWDQTKEANRWVRVTQVCKHWRSVALLDPLLWRNIVVNGTLFWRPDYPTDLVCEWLRRSKGALLDLTIW